MTSKDILGLVSVYSQSAEKQGTLEVSCPLIVEMVDYMLEIESSLVGFKAGLRADKINMLGDQVFLDWVFERMIDVHGENPDCDYMLRLRAIINSMVEG
jgi:hypothetical protein